MQPVEIEFLENTEETAPDLADIVSSSGGETKQVSPGSVDNFVGEVPSALDEDPDNANVFIVGGQTVLFDESVEEGPLKEAVTQVAAGSEALLNQEEQNTVVNSFNDLQNGNLNPVSSEDVIDEFVEDGDFVG